MTTPPWCREKVMLLLYAHRNGVVVEPRSCDDSVSASSNPVECRYKTCPAEVIK